MKSTNPNDFYFDDCPICRATKRAEEEGRGLSLNELKSGFKQAKQEGGVVGGEWIVDDPEERK